ncbi:MAG TPA: O-antigen ligase family protein [Candidatus Limnocylindrales bacterium]|nr:O-antigen ligase family protein [Candidatus Limnocylindrales bacterium]
MSSTLPSPITSTPLRGLARAILECEWLILLLMVAVVWFSDFNRIAALLLWLPLLAARWVLYRRLWPRTPLDLFFAAFFILGLISLFAAPYRYGPITLGGDRFILPVQYTVIALGRPLLGMVLVTSFADMALRRGHVLRLLLTSAALALLVGLLGLLSAQYTVKSLSMQALIDLLPRMTSFPGAEGGFNVNEIAGAMAWLTPLMAGLSFYFWRARAQETNWIARVLRVLAPLAFVLLWAALFLGQSRFALIGVLPALALLVWMLLRGRWRWLGLAAVALFTVLQLLLYFAPASTGAPADRLDRHNEISSSSRLEMWSSGLAILRDYPLTGVGVNMYRAGPVRDRYPVPAYATGILPHAHNEWLQAATDLGLPGLLVFIGFQAAVAWMLWRAWCAGSARDRALALAIGAGLAAHFVYGLGDAITLWDRFAFVYWWLIGLAAAQYVIVRQRSFAAEEALRQNSAT